MADASVSLDGLAADLVARCGCHFTIASQESHRDLAYRLRYRAVIDQGWLQEVDLPDGREWDRYDARAVHVLGWDGNVAVATGRLVLPPGPLPTEDACGIRVEPEGPVVDVGRMVVDPSHQSPGHSVFIGLLARLYLEVRERGYTVGCGLMSTRARSLMRLLGLSLEVVGAERSYWGEPRAPVRFSVFVKDPDDTWNTGK